MRSITAILGILATNIALHPARAGDADDLSKRLANPVAQMTSVPIQSNFDFKGGVHDKGFATTTNFQPVIPIPAGDDWSLVIRTIVPVIGRDRYGPADGVGVGDVTQSFFLTPRHTGNFVWGVGPAFLWPTGTDRQFGAGKWGAGPTALALLQHGPWTFGLLTNHIWSYAGPDGRRDVSATLVQPFLSHRFGHGFSASINAQSTYDWVAKAWTVPINVGVAQIVKIGAQPVSLSLALKYDVLRPDGAPHWGVQTTVTFLFPH